MSRESKKRRQFRRALGRLCAAAGAAAADTLKLGEAMRVAGIWADRVVAAHRERLSATMERVEP